MFLKRKKIIFLISALMALNLIFIFDIFFIDGAIAQESYCYSKTQVYYYPESLIVSESSTCDSDCNIENNGRLLFKYYGEDSDCSLGIDKRLQSEKECNEDYPFGGPGTLETGGNLAINNARGLYLNGQDGMGFHWILSGTQTEPQGRAMGFRLGLEDVYFGRNIVVGDDLNLKGIIDLVDDNYVARDRKKRIIERGLFCTPGYPIRYPFNEINFNDNLHILEGNDTDNAGGDSGVCAYSTCDGDNLICTPGSGSDYRTISDESTVIKGNLKVEDDIYVFWSFTIFRSSAKVNYYKMIVRDYYRQIEERKEEYAAHTACCSIRLTERECYGIYYPNISGVRWCWPQPLNHYKIINYRYDPLSNSAVGDIVLCPAEGDMTTALPSNVSCQGCESSDLISYPTATTYGCSE